MSTSPSRTEPALSSHQSAQELVTRFFEDRSGHWTDVYSGRDVFADIHRHRQQLALSWVEDLRLPPGSRALEVGVGAGFCAVELARRGFTVIGIDHAPAMLRVAREAVARAGMSGSVSVARADAHSLGMADGRVDLVVALGVVPWLYAPELALSEMSRVLSPDGWLIANADNRARLDHRLDPGLHPRLRPLKNRLRDALRGPLGEPRAREHSIRDFRAMLGRAGLDVVRTRAFGFGPFTLLGVRALPDRIGRPLNRGLTRLAVRGVPVLRTTGSLCLALARKPPARLP